MRVYCRHVSRLTPPMFVYLKSLLNSWERKWLIANSAAAVKAGSVKRDTTVVYFTQLPFCLAMQLFREYIINFSVFTTFNGWTSINLFHLQLFRNIIASNPAVDTLYLNAVEFATLQLVLISLLVFLVSSSMDCKNSSKDPFEMRKYTKTYCLILLSRHTVNEKKLLKKNKRDSLLQSYSFFFSRRGAN